MKSAPPPACAPRPFDPHGPEQIKMPHGRFRWTYLMLVAFALVVIGIAVVGLTLG